MGDWSLVIQHFREENTQKYGLSEGMSVCFIIPLKYQQKKRMMRGLIFNLQGVTDAFRGNGENDFIVMGDDCPLTWKISKVAPNRELGKEVSLGETICGRKDSQTLNSSLLSRDFFFAHLWSS